MVPTTASAALGVGSTATERSDPECKAGKDEWHESAPKSWQPNKKHKSGKGGKGKGKGKGGADGMRGGSKNAGSMLRISEDQENVALAQIASTNMSSLPRT